MSANREFKASFFNFLFSDTEVLRELYSALEGISLPPDIPVTINTLENILSGGRVNDISFEIGGRLVVLIEHQSTINPNMALRLLMYIARLYERLIGGRRSVYASQRIALPRPEFFLLYNGEDPCPDEQVYRLSDAFLDLSGIAVADSGVPSLELMVKVLNINQGRNEGIARGCKTLAGYQAFVAKAREYIRRGYGLENALKKTVLYCREHDILKETLEQHEKEVIGMLATEWNWEDALAVRFEEGMERGIEQGFDQGMERGIEQGMAEGMERGIEQGFDQGREEGIGDVARKLRAMGIPAEQISAATGLDIETIESLMG